MFPIYFPLVQKKYTSICVWREGEGRRKEGELIKKMGANCKPLVNLGKKGVWEFFVLLFKFSVSWKLHQHRYPEKKFILYSAKSFYFYNDNIASNFLLRKSQ